MKRIVAYIFPVTGGSFETDPPAQPVSEPLAEGRFPDGGEIADSARQPLRLEAILSDVQAQRVLALLMDQESPRDASVMIEEMLDRQLSLVDPQAGDLFERIVLEVERQLITHVFDECERVKTRAAARLGIDRNTLHKKLRKYNLDQEPV
jgi:DNA-binding protein Fis